jgi:hypothetical protein
MKKLFTQDKEKVGFEYLCGEEETRTNKLRFWIDTDSPKSLAKAKTFLALLNEHKYLELKESKFYGNTKAWVFYPKGFEIVAESFEGLLEFFRLMDVKPGVILPVRNRTGMFKQNGTVIFIKESNASKDEVLEDLEFFLTPNKRWLNEKFASFDKNSLNGLFDKTARWGDTPWLKR